MLIKIPSLKLWFSITCYCLIITPATFSQEQNAQEKIEQLHAVTYKAGDSPDKYVREIRGTVSDSAGRPLPGVSITVKNRSSIGTSTDMNGKYILNVPDDAVLQFTMIGYETVEISVKGREVIDIGLKKANNSMEDVVVVGYAKQRKKDVVGSVTTVNPSDLK